MFPTLLNSYIDPENPTQICRKGDTQINISSSASFSSYTFTLCSIHVVYVILLNVVLHTDACVLIVLPSVNCGTNNIQTDEGKVILSKVCTVNTEKLTFGFIPEWLNRLWNKVCKQTAQPKYTEYIHCFCVLLNKIWPFKITKSILPSFFQLKNKGNVQFLHPAEQSKR